MLRAVSWTAALAALATAFVAPAGPAAGQTVNPDATIVVANLHPVEGESVPVHNAANEASRCVGGIAVVIVNGLPPGPLSQLVAHPDENGDWSVTLYVPFQADWPSNDVSGPYTLSAFCYADTSPTGVSAAAEPEFAYVPVQVTVEHPAPEPPVTSVEPLPVAEPVAAAPAFTG